MTHSLLFSAVLALGLSFGAVTPTSAQGMSPVLSGADTLHIIPRPQQVAIGQGEFVLRAQTHFTTSGKGAKAVAQHFSREYAAGLGFAIPVKGNKPMKGSIHLAIDKVAGGSEAYTLEVTPMSITARANTERGLFYAMQTLFQLLPASVEQAAVKTRHRWSIPAVNIADAPRYGYRGVMLDPCRHFIPFEELKRQIDLFARYKINTLHLHLTEDQGWRIEIKKYPRLTEVGAWRTAEDGTRHGGYYTQEQLKALVRYAAERHIRIIPELELPGHGLAAIAAYPWLSCKGDSITPRLIWGVEDILMCPAKPRTFQFLEDVIAEMVKIFPEPYFHIGGDEAPKRAWRECKDCQALIAREGLTDSHGHSKEDKLQNYVVAHFEQVLARYGKRLIGWDEILEGGNLTKGATVMSWRGESGGIAAAKEGRDVIMSPNSNGLYVDYYQGDPEVEPMALCCWQSIKNIYNYNPTPQVLVQEGKAHHVLGVQANTWSEYLPTIRNVEYALYPRALALAEIGWTQPQRKDYTDFIRRLDSDAATRLAAHGVNFHIPIPEQPGGSINRLAFTDSTRLTLTTSRPVEAIVYTTDGSTPTAQSTRYTTPLTITESTTLRTSSVLASGHLSKPRTITLTKQALMPAVATPAVLDSGLAVHKFDGLYFHWRAVEKTQPTTLTLRDLNHLRQLTPVPADVRGVKHYAAIAEGYIRLPKDGVYTFSTDNAYVDIDGVRVIDNNATPQRRGLRGKAQAALQAGWHKVRIGFLGNVYAGWPSYWGESRIFYRVDGDSKWQAISPEMLMHTP